MSPGLSFVLASVMALGSAMLFYKLRERQFARRNSLGVECFRSYAHMARVRAGESLVRLLGFVMVAGSGALFLYGAMSFHLARVTEIVTTSMKGGA